jgi:cell division septation protein DedD
MNLNRNYRRSHWLLVCFFAAASLLPGRAWAAYENWFNKGLEALKAQQYDQAVQAFTITVETIPNDYEAYNNRGIAWSQMGDQDRAIADYTRAIEINPDYYLAFLNRGIDWRKKGLIGNAITDYINAIELRGDYLQAYKNLAWLLATCPEDRFRDGSTALKVIEKAHQIRPQAILLDAEAAALAENGQFEAAQEKQQQYLLLLKANNRQDHLAINQSRLRTYQKNQPWRDEYGVSSAQASEADARQLVAQINRLMSRDLPNPQQPQREPDEPAPEPAAVDSVKPMEPIERRAEPITPIAAASSGPWSAQVGAFAVAANAYRLAEKLHRAEFTVFTSPIEIPDKGRLFRVLVGSFAKRGDVRPTAINLNGRFQLKSILTKLPYAIQVAKPADADQMKQLERQLSIRGLSTLPSAPADKSKPYPVLRIGAFSSHQQAALISAALREQGFHAEVIQR